MKSKASQASSRRRPAGAAGKRTSAKKTARTAPAGDANELRTPAPAASRQEGAPKRERLLALLADGQFRSGEALAKRLRVSRSAIWKMIVSLRELNIDIHAVPRQGYNLAHAVDLYDADKIKAHLPPDIAAKIESLEALLTVDSTNRVIAGRSSPAPGNATVCVAEVQQAGRGRRGRSWVAPFGSGICLSIGWCFEDLPPNVSALSLVVGMALVRVLRRFGAGEVGLKWPNDLLFRGRKLGGILIELRGESSGPAQVVIGIGLNMRMPAETRLMLVEQQAALVADVHEILRDRTPNRNELAAAILVELFAMLCDFSRRGFQAFHADWTQFDALSNSPVRVLTSEETLQGIARGVDADGALLLEVDGLTRRYISGEVSLRTVSVR